MVGPALFALALAVSHGDDETRAPSFEALPRVARNGSHLHDSWDMPTPCAAGAAGCAELSPAGTQPDL